MLGALPRLRHPFEIAGLSGAVGMSAFTFFLPFAFSWELFGLHSRWTMFFYAVNIFIGGVIMFGGLYASLSDLAEASSDPAPCHLQYSYSPLDPEDPCYNNVSLPLAP